MKIAVISDIHDNQINLKKCLNWIKENKIKKIVCCGDITNSETLDILANDFDGKIFLVKGNVEIYREEELEKYNNIEYGGRIGIFKIGEKIVGACHEPFLIDKIFKKGEPDIIFYGQTHKPWLAKKRGIEIINPGTLGGMFFRATFAIWDRENKKLELKILDTL